MATKRPSSGRKRPRVRFPGDEGAHPRFALEWWYGSFSLADAQGREYAAMVAYFNVGLKILAVTDLGAERLHHTARGSALHQGEGDFDLHWGVRDHWYRIDPSSYLYHVESHSDEIGLKLELASEKPPLLGCGNGLIQWTGGKSYYYCFTRLRARGEIELEGAAVRVEGTGFMDHQWMNYLGEGGWDWFAVQLDDGSDIVLWRIVEADESPKSRDLAIMFADNSVYLSQDFLLDRLDTWVSPESGNEYGTLWRVRDDARGLDLEIKARYPEQEIRLFPDASWPAFAFWEGRTTVSGRLNGEVVAGIGCAEVFRTPTWNR